MKAKKLYKAYVLSKRFDFYIPFFYLTLDCLKKNPNLCIRFLVI